MVCFSGRNRMQEPSSRRRRARFGWRTGTLLSEASCGTLRFSVQRRGSGPCCDLNQRVGILRRLSPENLARGRGAWLEAVHRLEQFLCAGTSRAA